MTLGREVDKVDGKVPVVSNNYKLTVCMILARASNLAPANSFRDLNLFKKTRVPLPQTKTRNPNPRFRFDGTLLGGDEGRRRPARGSRFGESLQLDLLRDSKIFGSPLSWNAKGYSVGTQKVKRILIMR